MSGAEIAGVVLAIFPLLNKSLAAYQTFMRANEEIQALQTLVKAECGLFQTMIESLATINHPDQVAGLGQNLGSNVLRDTTFKFDIRGSLGPSADVFMDLIVAYGEKIAKIQRELEQVSVSSVA